MRRIRGIFIAGVIVALGLLGWAVLIEPGMLRFKEHKIYVKGWPQSLSGFTIAFITDPHIGSPHITLKKLQKIVLQTNARQPDKHPRRIMDMTNWLAGFL